MQKTTYCGFFLGALAAVGMIGLVSNRGWTDVHPSPNVQLQGTIEKVVLGPSGKPDGLVLQDHSFIEIPSEGLTNLYAVRPGNRVSALGTQVISSPNPVLIPMLLKADGQILFRASSPAQADVFQTDAERPPEMDGALLKSSKAAAPLLAVGTRPNGEIDRLILQDGTVAQVPAGGSVQAGQLRLGEKLKVSGVGVGLPSEKWIEVMSVQPSDQASQLLTTAAVGGQGWKVIEGKVDQRLLTPSGAVDGVLLKDHTAIRFSPVSQNQAMLLMSGTKIRAAGPAAQNQVQSQVILIPGVDRVVDLSQGQVVKSPMLRNSYAQYADVFGPPGLAPDQANQIAVKAPNRAFPSTMTQKLKSMTESGPIDTILKDSQGRIDSLVMKNGTRVVISPEVRAKLPAGLQAGDRVKVTGRGGNYSMGSALEAESIQRKA